MKSFIFVIALSAIVMANAVPVPKEESESKQLGALGSMAGSLMPSTPSTLGIGMKVASAVVSALSTGNPIEDAQRLYKLYKAYEAITDFLDKINPMTYLPSSSQAMADLENLTSNLPSVPADISNMIPAVPLPTGRQLTKKTGQEITLFPLDNTQYTLFQFGQGQGQSQPSTPTSYAQFLQLLSQLQTPPTGK